MTLKELKSLLDSLDEHKEIKLVITSGANNVEEAELIRIYTTLGYPYIELIGEN